MLISLHSRPSLRSSRVLGDAPPPLAPEPVAILAFHRIANRPDDELSFPPARLRQLCAYWRAEYQVVSLGDCLGLAPRMRQSSAAFHPRLVLTFDDGYADNAETAAGILAAAGLPAAFFLPSALIGSSLSYPWDASYSPPPRIMNWAQARQLLRSGFTIGSHTRTHARLSACDPPRREVELRQSRAELERALGVAILDFAFPFGGPGDCRDEDRHAVARAGYRCCLSCYGGLADVAQPLRLRRISMSPRYHATPKAWERQLQRAWREFQCEPAASPAGIRARG